MGASEFDTLLEAIQYAQRLFKRALQASRAQERADIALFEQRVGQCARDLRAGIVVHLLSSILRGAVEESFIRIGREPLRATFSRRLAAARSVFAS